MRTTGDALRLAAGEEAPGHSFANPAWTARDLAVLGKVRAALREKAVATRRRSRWTAADGAVHWLVVPDWELLVSAAPATAIGFFGQAREDVDHGPIVALEHELLAHAEAIDGLLAYHNVRFADGQWGNLVVFAAADDPAGVRADVRHVEAVSRTPRHYHSLRLHVGTLDTGALGELEPRIARTLYLDFSSDPPWRAVRNYALT
jgi:hypothetical protein